MVWLAEMRCQLHYTDTQHTPRWVDTRVDDGDYHEIMMKLENKDKRSASVHNFSFHYAFLLTCYKVKNGIHISSIFPLIIVIIQKAAYFYNRVSQPFSLELECTQNITHSLHTKWKISLKYFFIFRRPNTRTDFFTKRLFIVSTCIV